jgi:hypothetical protein
MVRTIREVHYEQLKGLSPQEKIAFFRQKARNLHADLGKPEELLVNSSSASKTRAPRP